MSALSYPGVVMVLALFTVAVLAGYVLPQFKPLFEELERRPAAADAAAAVRRRPVHRSTVYIPLSAFVAVHRRVVLAVQDRQRADRSRTSCVLKIPVIRGIIEYAILERFCRILGAMVKAGVPLPEGLKTTTEATNNIVYREQLDDRPGSRCWRAAASPSRWPTPSCSPAPPGRCSRSARRPERSTSSSRSPAIYFDRELESRIKKFTTMFEPIMIVFVGVIVGFVAIALVSAMYGVLGQTKEAI